MSLPCPCKHYQLQPADRAELGLPLCPEVCILCRDRTQKTRHIFHVIDELGELSVRMSDDGKHMLIEGSASSGDCFWLRRIFKMAYEAVAEKE